MRRVLCNVDLLQIPMVVSGMMHFDHDVVRGTLEPEVVCSIGSSSIAGVRQASDFTNYIWYLLPVTGDQSVRHG